MLLFPEVLYLGMIGMKSNIPFYERFLIVHNIFIRGLLEPEDGDIPEVGIIDVLNKLKLFFENSLILHWNVITHSL